MYYIEKYQNSFNDYVETLTTPDQPEGLYNPIMYMLGLGGKRLRPVLTLMVTDMYSGNYERALDAAMAVEVFHNFSLIHDDIMDDAPLRRGKQTVHEKWNLNTGILSGDAMLILAYKFFENYQGVMFKSLISLFSKTAIEVCEGQQHDIDFETRDDVSLQEYLTMITQKTAVLLGCALQMGAIVAKASESDSRALYQFGVQLGIAFQLQDDYLDTFGDPAVFGKQVGGDIISNKKTYLYLTALSNCNEKDKKRLVKLFSESPKDSSQKIIEVKKLYLESGAAKQSLEEIANFTKKANTIIEKLNINKSNKNLLRSFSDQLMNRKV